MNRNLRILFKRQKDSESSTCRVCSSTASSLFSFFFITKSLSSIFIPRQFEQSAFFYLYRLHLRVHHDDKRYECDECGKTFIRHDHLTKHKKIHSGKFYFVFLFPKLFKNTVENIILLSIFASCGFNS